MMKKVLAIAAVVVLSGCSGEDLPSRDEIPVLRKTVYAVEQAVAANNRAGLDSLLSVQMLDEGESGDSLLSFIYGPDRSFPFHRLGDCQIFYTRDLAVVDCFVMDSTETTDRPIKLYFTKSKELWLLKKFEPGEKKAADGE
jgi:hypothetical protein